MLLSVQMGPLMIQTDPAVDRDVHALVDEASLSVRYLMRLPATLKECAPLRLQASAAEIAQLLLSRSSEECLFDVW